MTDTAAISTGSTGPQQSAPAMKDIVVRIEKPQFGPDYMTIFGLFFSVGLILGAILMGETDANFFNLPSVMIVILGTIAATSVSYSGKEIAKAGSIISQSLFMHRARPKVLARELMDIAVVIRKKGVLALAGMDSELKKDRHLYESFRILVDGYNADDAERVLTQDLDALMERHRRSAAMLRRAAEIAPGMGLIGTLVGLVQMLSNLQDPGSIGPAMAVALLTTFYGAVMSTVVLSPMAAKLERNSNIEALLRTLVMMAIISIARQENPRRLEMLLNSELPPEERIVYFK